MRALDALSDIQIHILIPELNIHIKRVTSHSVGGNRIFGEINEDDKVTQG